MVATTTSKEAAIIAGSPSICPLHCLTEFGAATKKDTLEGASLELQCL